MLEIMIVDADTKLTEKNRKLNRLGTAGGLAVFSLLWIWIRLKTIIKQHNINSLDLRY